MVLIDQALGPKRGKYTTIYQIVNQYYEQLSDNEQINIF